MMRIKFALVAIAAAVLSMSCGGGLGELGGGGVGGLSAECGGDFGTNAAAMKLEAFLQATDTFVGTAEEIANSLTETCKAMGQELGIPDGEMEGEQPRAACAAVAAKIQSEMQDLRASANLEIVVAVRPPQCSVSVDAYASCAAECQADIDPGSVDVQCEGGELRGGCSGECTGSCSVEASGSCSGSCEGTCEGGCRGTCQGTCDGTCSAQGANGQCNGRCDGTCQGSCSANCQGSCSGQCVVEAEASCSGECRGSCSVEFTEPTCTGTVRPPSMSAECEASCDARLDAQAECTPGEVYVSIQGEVGENVSDRVARLRQAFESGLSSILGLKAKLERLGASGEAMVSAGRDVPDAVADLGVNAARCAGQAVAALPAATAQVSVSIEVSASVSGSAGAG